MIFGAVIDDSMKDEVRVTVIATGFGAARQRRRRPALTSTTEEQRPPREEREERSQRGGFDVPDDVLEVPSFLRDE